MGRKPYRVAVVGGGVAGLSTAHELAERGFEVHVYERRRYYGGKAASVVTGLSGDPYSKAPKGLPGEHGFRFFPGWYRHLPDTMKRIPYKDGFVYDNLVGADVNLLVERDRDPVRALVRFPTSLGELRTVASLPAEILRLGLTVDDMQFFFGKLWEFLTSSEERRLREYETISWWDFLEAPTRSREFRNYLVTGATRNTVAAKPTEASAYTIAKVTLQTLFDTLTPQTLFDRVLNGPTNEVWIDPWIDYLRGMGVTFHDDCELEAIEFDGDLIKRLKFSHPEASRTARAKRRVVELAERFWGANCQLAEEDVDALVDENYAELADGVEARTGKVERWFKRRAEEITEARASSGRSAVPPLAQMVRQADVELQRVKSDFALTDGVDHFVFAVPVEQMAYYVQRTPTLTHYAPALKTIIPLSEHVDWMAGIQFYLTSVVNITRGHIDLLDSPWAVTAISQVQFWKDTNVSEFGDGALLKGKVRSILSVDISAWDVKGRLRNKEAFNCEPQEIAEEVWDQLKYSLNRPGKADVLKDEMLLDSRGGPGVPPQSYYLDDSIVDRFDRKKQAVYDRARSVDFDTNELLRKQKHGGAAAELNFVAGTPLKLNAEPLLINRPGSLALRPTARTQIANMFLAADYVRTHTNLATMEGANEAARAAVNAILLACGSHERPCEIWPPSEPFQFLRSIDENLFRRGQRFQDTYADIPVRLAAGAANTTARLAAKALMKLIENKRGR